MALVGSYTVRVLSGILAGSPHCVCKSVGGAGP